MRIAWNEITYQPKKFVLIEFLIATLMFMVVFLSGLTNGLAASVSAQIENYGPLTYILSTDSEGVIPYSSVTDNDINALEAAGMHDYASLVIQRATPRTTTPIPLTSRTSRRITTTPTPSSQPSSTPTWRFPTCKTMRSSSTARSRTRASTSVTG